MFEDYKKELLEFYFLKKESNQLSTTMENPERLKLKKECIRIYAIKNSKEDSEIIKAFFDPLGKYEDPFKSIDRFELDKFRPLINFLTKGTVIRDEEPVKLLAWLIEFNSYQDWKVKKYGAGLNPYLGTSEDGNCSDDDENFDMEEGKGEIAETDEDCHHDELEKLTQHPEPPEDNENGSLMTSQEETQGEDVKETQSFEEKRTSYRKFGVYVIAGFLLFSIAIILQQGKWFEIDSLPTEKCMYWDGDKYVSVKCEKSTAQTGIIPLQKNLYKNFKKIGWSDTLSKNAVGKVWYAKRNGEYEFFTDSGMHPMDSQKKLKPLSNYIISNHLSYHRFILQIVGWGLSLIIILLIIFFLIKKLLRKKQVKPRLAQ